MSIYVTYWRIRLPAPDSSHFDPTWVTVWAQAVPSHIGSKTLGEYEEDPYADFLPPPIEIEGSEIPRAVVFVTDKAEQVGERYVHPLLVLTGQEYLNATFEQLLRQLFRALPRTQP